MVNSSAHARGCSTTSGKCAFLARSWVGCSWDLCNFWTEQLTAAQICANFGLRRPTGKDCKFFWGKLSQQNCTILGPNRLLLRIAQFLEVRVVSLHICANSACWWTKSNEQPMRVMHQGLIDMLSFCKKTIGAFVLDKERHAVVKVGREALKQS